MTRERHPLTVDECHADTADGAGEGQARQHRGRGCRVDGQYVVEHVRVEREDGHNNLNLIAQTLDKRGTKWAIDQAAGEDGILGWPTLTTKE